MPPRKNMKKRAYGKKKAYRKRPISKGLAGVPEAASLTEIVALNLNGQGRYTCNTPYQFYNASLNLTTRAKLVAQAYQEYRIRRVTVVWKAGLDTFAAIGTPATSLSVPELYYMVDKKMALPGTFDHITLQQSGAIPRRFDDKSFTTHYAPAVLQSSVTDPMALTTALAASNISPWLPTNLIPLSGTTNVSDVDHTGIVWFVRQSANVAQGNSTYDVDIMLDIEFRKPRITQQLRDIPPAVAVTSFLG